MKTRFLRWGLMLGLPVMAAFAIVWNVSAEDTYTPPEMCPIDGSDSFYTILLPNPDGNCCTFFECSNGVPILRYCPTGMGFNSTLGVCDWPQSSDCGAGCTGSEGNGAICYSETKVKQGRTCYRCSDCPNLKPIYNEKGVGSPSKCPQ